MYALSVSRIFFGLYVTHVFLGARRLEGRLQTVYPIRLYIHLFIQTRLKPPFSSGVLLAFDRIRCRYPMRIDLVRGYLVGFPALRTPRLWILTFS